MINIIDLEQLDFRDQLIKDYIDNNMGGGSGESSGTLFYELEVCTDLQSTPRAHLYLKCYKGDILETDTIQFARNTSTPTQWIYEDDTRKCVKRRRGWIIPKAYNYLNLYKVYDENKSSTSDIYDYWEILPKNRELNPVSWEEIINEFLLQRHNNISEEDQYGARESVSAFGLFNNNYACFVNRWCGIGVIRDGKLLSSYKRWMIAGPDDYNGEIQYKHFKSKYAKNGQFLKDYIENGESEELYAYGLRI